MNRDDRSIYKENFHEYYVIKFVEEGERRLSCRNREYTIDRWGHCAV